MRSRYDTAPSHQATGARIGFYGCSRDGHARVVSVEIAIEGRRKPPLSATVLCPHCRERHTVGLLWREPRPDEHGEIRLEEGE